MQALTVNEAAATTGWSPRMLRYIERVGLLETPRSQAGYRLYGPAELQRLSALRELLERHDVALSDIGFVARLRNDPQLSEALEQYFELVPDRPAHVAPGDWLRFEQDKHERLLSLSAA